MQVLKLLGCFRKDSRVNTKDEKTQESRVSMVERKSSQKRNSKHNNNNNDRNSDDTDTESVGQFISNLDNDMYSRSSDKENEFTYICGDMLGSGTFGNVYRCKSKFSNDSNKYAAKILNRKGHQSYFREIRSLTYLNLKCGINHKHGIPSLFWYGLYKGKDTLVVSRLGTDLNNIFINHNKKFDVKTTLKLGYQMINIISLIHKHGIIHRDIKPHNFMVGYKHDSNKLYLVDFGLSKFYINYNEPMTPKGKTINKLNKYKHVRMLTDSVPVGTARYASINVHKLLTPSRRDDLESIGFILIYFLLSKLPWQGVTIRTKSEKWSKIGKAKASVSLDDLCKNDAKCMLKYAKIVRKLKFDEKPNYDLLLKCFIDEAKSRNIDLFDDNFKYCWQ